MSVALDESACTGCASCVFVCPEEALADSSDFVVALTEEACTDCLLCVDYCPTQALRA